MPEFHSEPYLHIGGLSHKSALIAWGAFYFRVHPEGGMKLVDDDDLQWVHPPRHETIGARSAPYGPARVEVRDEAGTVVAEAMTNTANHCIVSGLTPDTRYDYSVYVKDELWGADERWDWSPAAKGLRQEGRSYRNAFRTLPDPAAPRTRPFTSSSLAISARASASRRPRPDDSSKWLPRSSEPWIVTMPGAF